MNTAPSTYARSTIHGFVSNPEDGYEIESDLEEIPQTRPSRTQVACRPTNTQIARRPTNTYQQTPAVLPSQNAHALHRMTTEGSLADAQEAKRSQHFQRLYTRLLERYMKIDGERERSGSSNLTNYECFVLRTGDEVIQLMVDLVERFESDFEVSRAVPPEYTQHVTEKCTLAYGLLRGFELAEQEKLGQNIKPKNPNKPKILVLPPPPQVSHTFSTVFLSAIANPRRRILFPAEAASTLRDSIMGWICPPSFSTLPK